MMEGKDNQRSNRFLHIRWQEAHLPLYTKYANLICIVLMLLTIPTDFVSFPSEEAWRVVNARFTVIILFLLDLLLLMTVAGKVRKPTLMLNGLLFTTILAINSLYLFFLFSMDSQYRLAVTTGCLTAILGTHVFLYRFYAVHNTYSLVYGLMIAITSAVSSEWRSLLIPIFLGHATGFALSLFFRKVFQQSLEKDYLIKIQAEAIRKQSEQIEATLKDKDNLLRILVHDIANPLCVIMGNETFLAEKESHLDQTSVKRLAKIHNACLAIDHLIVHVREFEAVRSGKKAVKIAPCSLNEALDGALLMIEAKAEAKNVNIQVHYTKTRDILCAAEGLSLTHQVLVNILSNAIKFSAIGGKVDVQISRQETTAEISIRDYGVGIPADIMEGLFNPSKPTTRTGTAGEKGTGFGMPLAKAYVDKFGGQLRIESRTVEKSPDAHGTTVVIILPLWNSKTSGAAAA
jgi:signal transduction histidine kinase